MKDTSDARVAASGEAKALTILQVAVPFIVTFALGMLVTAVVALFVYANAANAASRDVSFLIAVVVGVGASFIAARMAVRRTLDEDAASNVEGAFGLLKKYRRRAAAPGSDSQTGQYSIGEQYLRDLMRRRGA